MNLSLQTMQRILLAGGGLRICAKGMPVPTLVELAHAARDGDAQLVIELRGANLTQDVLVKLATAGGGAIVFDLTRAEQNA